MIGAWQIETVSANKIRFDMPISRNESAGRYEVDCSDLSYVQVAIVAYDRDGNSGRTIPVNNPLSDPSVLPILRQVCAISRSESTKTWGEFHSIAEFRTQVANIDPAYFEGQPPCQRLHLVGPGTTSPNH
ncbi:MAG: hypothetical protein EBR82_22360 [Caulobacteraceae bacterium]|nr:hypothetical protein [Caulobacteraceae bacterium]